MGGWDDRSYYEEEAAQFEFIQETLKNISEDGVRNYLGTYGDAVGARIEHCMKEARMLLSGGFNQSAIVSAVTAIELTVRFLLLRPLMQAAFMSEEWANLLTQRIASGRSANEREILPQILGFHGIDLNGIKLADKSLLWSTITGSVYPARDKIVHRGEPVSEDDAVMAINCAEQLRMSVVTPLCGKAGIHPEDNELLAANKDGIVSVIVQSPKPLLGQIDAAARSGAEAVGYTLTRRSRGTLHYFLSDDIFSGISGF